MRRLARYNGLTRLVTFTNGAVGDGWETRKSALDDVARFLKVHGQSCFGGAPAVMVAEQGGKGARWHVHAVVPGGSWLPYSRIIRAWSAFMEGRGWRSVKGTHRWHSGDDQGRHKGGFSSARVAGRYLSKYLTKALIGDDYGTGIHRYRVVHADNPVAVQSDFPLMGDALETLNGVHLSPIEVPDADGVLYCIGYWFDSGGG